MIQFNVMFRTGDERKRREKSVGIGKSSHEGCGHGRLRKDGCPGVEGIVLTIVGFVSEGLPSPFLDDR